MERKEKCERILANYAKKLDTLLEEKNQLWSVFRKTKNHDDRRLAGAFTIAYNEKEATYYRLCAQAKFVFNGFCHTKYFSVK